MAHDTYIKHMFAKRLRGLREAAGLSQDDLAKALGVSRGSISYYENESRVPDIVFLECVSDYFDVGINFLMGYSDNLSPSNEGLGLRIDFSDEAIEKLQYNNAGMMLSDLIESNYFDDFINIAEYFYLPLSFGSKPDFTEQGLFSDEFEYYSYQAARIFTAMLLERKAEVVNYFFEKFKDDFTQGDIEKKIFLEKKRDEELARITAIKENYRQRHVSWREDLENEFHTNSQPDDSNTRKQRFDATRAYIASESKNDN